MNAVSKGYCVAIVVEGCVVVAVVTGLILLERERDDE